MRDREGSEGEAGRNGDSSEEARSRYQAMSDHALVGAMRRYDTRAIEEFIRRFQSLAIVEARRLRIPPADRRRWVAELLYELALVLCRRETPAPDALGAYLVTTLRRRVFATHRKRMVRERLETWAAGEIGGGGERALLASCSEASVRATYGPGWTPFELPRILARLAAAIDEGTTADERQLLSWVGKRVPYSTIAAWLGISRSAAVKRVTRLRVRLTELTMRFAESLDGADRPEIARFLGRTSAFDEKFLASLTGATPRMTHASAVTTGRRNEEA